MIWTKFLFPPKYPKIYVTIDIHGTILKPTFSTDLSTRFYPFSKKVLQDLSKDPKYVLILWSSSRPSDLMAYLKMFRENSIVFNYLGENPEATNTEYAYFDKKHYTDIGLDDKFGFSPTIEWPLIWLVRKVITLIYDK